MTTVSYPPPKPTASGEPMPLRVAIREGLLALEIEITLAGGFVGEVRRGQQSASFRLDLFESLRQELAQEMQP